MWRPVSNPLMQPTNAGGARLRPQPPSPRQQWTVSYHRSFAADAHFGRRTNQ